MIFVGEDNIRLIYYNNENVNKVTLNTDIYFEQYKDKDITVVNQLTINTGAIVDLGLSYGNKIIYDIIIKCDNENVVINNNKVYCKTDGSYNITLIHNNIIKQATLTSVPIIITIE